MSVSDIRWPTDPEVLALLAPLVSRQFADGDPEWSRIASDNAKLQRQARRRRRLIGWIPAFRRTQASVESNYSQQWHDRPLDTQVEFTGAVIPFQWRNDHMLARAVAIKRVHLLYLMRAIAALRPKIVLDVGCGNGLNLLLLASRFPNLTCIGVELTKGGVEAVRAVGAQGPLSEAVQRFAPEPLVDLEPFDRVHVIRGTASKLPLAAASADLVITTLALEQMEEIRNDAINEIGRVCRGHALMIEAFRDWNDDGCRRDFIVANDYFAASIADLAYAHLNPVFTKADLPSKLNYQAGVVLSAPDCP